MSGSREVHDGSTHGCALLGSLVEDALHALVRIEEFALADTECRQAPELLGSEQFSRLVLNDLVQHLERRTIFGHERVGAGTGAVHEVSRTCTVCEWVDLQVLLEPLDGLITHTDFTEATHHHPDPVARRLDREVSAGDLAIVVGPQEQVLATLPSVRPHEAEVDQELEAGVIGGAHHAGGDFDNRGAVDLQVE